MTEVTLYTNASSTSCNSASTVYETMTPASTLVVTVTTQAFTTLPTVPVMTPPYAAGNISTPCASSGMLAGPSGWQNPYYSSVSSKIPLGTATSSAVTRTSTLSTPTHTMWEGSGQSLTPPHLFFLLAKIISFAAPVRGQIANVMNDPNRQFQPYPEQYHESVTTGIGASTELSPLPAITSSSVATITASSAESVSSEIPGVISFPPEVSSSLWGSASINTTMTKTLESASVEPFTFGSGAGAAPSSEIDVTITFTTSNCSSATATSQTFSNVTGISTTVVYASSTVYANSTVTQFTTTTPTTSKIPDATTRNHSSSASPSTMSMHFPGAAASSQVIPGVLVGLGMLMMF